MVETPELLADSKLGESQKCVLPVKEINSILGCITVCIASSLRKVMISLYSALIGSHLGTAFSCRPPSMGMFFINWSKFSRGHQDCQRGWRTCPVRRG